MKTGLGGTANVKTLPDGTYYDPGGNLYLRVRNNGRARSWIFRYMRAGKIREIGMGPFKHLPLRDARKLAEKMQEALGRGDDPASVLPVKKGQTFAEVALALIAAKSAGWSNAKHRYQWTQSLETYAFPVVGKMLPRDITVNDVARVLRPIWGEKMETASRVRQRMEAVLDYAAVTGLRDRDRINPAIWKGNLQHVLPDPGKVAIKGHQRMIPYAEAPALYAALLASDGIASKAAAYAMLTASRSGEARNARWEEIQGNVWIVPACRMKSRKPHAVPLSDAALSLLERMRGADDVFLFPSPTRPGQAVSDIATLKAVTSIRDDGSVHGLRATFRTWAAEQSAASRETIEASLAHVIESKTEAAYQRGDLLEKRRLLMQEWADYLSTGGEA